MPYLYKFIIFFLYCFFFYVALCLKWYVQVYVIYLNQYITVRFNLKKSHFKNLTVYKKRKKN